jgi:hypothetical protein
MATGKSFFSAYFPNFWKKTCLTSFWDVKRGHPILPLSRGGNKKFIFCKNSKLESRSDFGNTFPLESYYEFAFKSTDLSPITNSESQRYQYPVCPAKAEPPIIPYPDSKVQRGEGRGSGLALQHFRWWS